MLLKIEFHSKWNIIKIGRSLKVECHSLSEEAYLLREKTVWLKKLYWNSLKVLNLKTEIAELKDENYKKVYIPLKSCT